MTDGPSKTRTRGTQLQNRSRTLVFAFRLLLLVVAASALGAAVLIGRVRDRNALGSAQRYVCPMHAEITSDAPGECPICRMQLEPIGGLNATTGSFNASTFQTYDFVRRRGFGQEVRAPAWVEGDGNIAAIVYADELSAFGPAEHGVFALSSAPNAPIDVRLAEGAPTAWDRSTYEVRFRPAPSATALTPGEIGYVHVPAKRRELAVIPYAAVLESADGPYVLVAATEGHAVTKRTIEIGRVIGGQAIVLSGLRVQERILVRSAFFVDAERRLRREATVDVAP